MREIGVVHLVRAKNGITPFKRFLKSYEENRGGMDHDLLIIYKGFSPRNDVSEYERLMRNIPHHAIFVRDVGFDIKPYFIAADSFHYKYFCFLNSFSVILDKEWLAKMYGYLSRDGVGLVGATGSYQSIFSDWLYWVSKKKKRPFYKRLLIRILRHLIAVIYKKIFDPFPNYHIRTNAFMISRDVMRRLRCNGIYSKLDTYKFESGKDNMTKQVMRMNLDVLVIGKDGAAYEKRDWFRSNTFWQRDQSNLLIADKQTDIYAHDNLEDKMILSQFAWRDNADPG